MYNNCEVLFAQDKQDELTDLLREMNFQITSFRHVTIPCANGTKQITMPDYEVLYLLKGTVRMTGKGGQYTCQAGGMIFLEPFENYVLEGTGAELDFYVIHFDASPAYRLPDLCQMVLGAGGPVFTPLEIPQLGLMFAILEKDIEERAVGYPTLLSVCFLRVLIYMCRYRSEAYLKTLSQRERSLTPRETQIVNDSLVFIDQNLSKPLKITDISAYLGISENYLYKSFMNVMRISPSRYLLQYKVKRAERLLRTGNYTVEQISKMLGFSSLFHFSKTFKDFFGASPKQYLKNISFQ